MRCAPTLLGWAWSAVVVVHTARAVTERKLSKLMGGVIERSVAIITVKLTAKIALLADRRARGGGAKVVT